MHGNDVPCKQCPVFPICKSKYNEICKEEVVIMYPIDVLAMTCSHLYIYMNSGPCKRNLSTKANRIYEVLEYFNG